MKGRRCIGHVEWHDQKFEDALARLECRLGDVIVVHPDLVVAQAQIQLGGEHHAAQLVE
jgi:aminoglycoside N3'-acetyltransferase